jgi:hypothetical protein
MIVTRGISAYTRGFAYPRGFPLDSGLGVFTWTSWAAPESFGTASKVVLLLRAVTWLVSAAVQACACDLESSSGSVAMSGAAALQKG